MSSGDDRERDGKPEPGADPGLLGREERLEDAAARRFIHARTVVFHDDDGVPVLQRCTESDAGRALSSQCQRLSSVLDQVEKNLLELDDDSHYRWQGGRILADDLDAPKVVLLAQV